MLTRMITTAVTNARHGLIDIAGSIVDRHELEPLTDESRGPGEMHRLDRDECVRLLASRTFGRYAHVESARALAVVPVNYVVQPDGSVLFRTGPGPKLSAADRRDVVAFQVDDIDEDNHTGWSVLVTGRARRLSHAEALALVDLPQPWANGPRHQFVLIEPTRIEGRRLT
jgi:nitroimidazol reductase NimA-like FMN-containing flavoprotein (pyridoxamine 5'-phosphate oxidase superfamily)